MSEPARSGPAETPWADLLRELRAQEPEQRLVLLRSNQHAHWENGQRLPAEAYLRHLADLPFDDETAIDLIYSEVLLRLELGEEPGVEEYLARFPQYAGPLREQFELLQAVQASEAMDTAGGGEVAATRSGSPDTLRLGSETDSAMPALSGL